MAPPASVRVRVSACVWDGERLLMVEHRKDDHSYWLLPGGGVQLGETLTDALVRETREETGLEVEVGRLLIVCEAIAPAERHNLELVFGATVRGGELAAGRDGRLVGVDWHAAEELPRLETHPDITGHLLACRLESFAGPVRVLGNVWRDHPGGHEPLTAD